MNVRRRVTAVIIKEGSLLLIRRIKPGLDYFIFPGGGVEEGESLEAALRREVLEELSLESLKFSFLGELKGLQVPQFLTMHSCNRDEYLYFVNDYNGTPEIGGPEKEKSSDINRYEITWIPIYKLQVYPNVYPKEVTDFVITRFDSNFS